MFSSPHELALQCQPWNIILSVKHHPVPYFKANLDHLKAEILGFQTQLLSSDPYSCDIETNWAKFKKGINDAIDKNIPRVPSKPKSYLP